MSELRETAISKAIVDSYHRKLLRSTESDVVIVGAGPAGLTAGSKSCTSSMPRNWPALSA